MFGLPTVSDVLTMKEPQGTPESSYKLLVLYTFGVVCFTLSLHSDIRLLSMSPFIQSEVWMRDCPLCLGMQGVWVLFLGGELRSCKPHLVVKINKVQMTMT